MTSRESTLNINNPLQGHSFASFLLGAPASGNVDVNPKPHYQWFFMAPWIQDDWRVNSKLTLNLGFRWDINGSVTEENNMLNYAFDPTIVNPVSARVGQQVMGGIRFAGVDGAPDRPWKLDKDNWQARVGMAYSLNDKTVLRAGYGKYFLNPTSQGNNAGFSLGTQLIESTRRRPDADLQALESMAQRDSGADREARSARRPSSAAARTSRTPTSSCRTSTSSRWVSSANCRGASRSMSPTRQAAATTWKPVSTPTTSRRRSSSAQCDVTQGGSRTLCDQLLPNPFFGVAGFEGTNRFTDPTLSRFELSRPFPAFAGITQNQNNIGKLTYDSLQFVANKRWAKGVTINASYTYVPRWNEVGGYVDAVSGLLNDTVYFSHRPHRFTGSGVWELPWYRDQRSIAATSLAGGRLRRRWSTSPASRGTCPATSTWRRASTRKVMALDGKKDGQFIYGVKPCIGVFNANTRQYDLASVSTAYGCTEPYFLIRQTFQRRTAMNRYDEFRRPGYFKIDMNFAKTTPITNGVRFQVRFEAFNLLNSPQYDERQYNQDTN